jgi:adenine-specific DNA-methyltransferase
VDARYLVLSYNTEGLIPFDELAALLEAQGELELRGSGYVKYRGGKQSIGRQVHNVELALVVDRDRPSTPAQRARRRRFHLEQRLGLLLRGAFHPARVAAEFPATSAGIPLRLAGREVLLPMQHMRRFTTEAASVLAAAAAEPEELDELLNRLATCACRDRAEELEVLARDLDDGIGEEVAGQAQRRALWLLRKLAHRKHRQRYEECAALLTRLAAAGRYPVLARGLEAVQRQAAARFAG